VKRVEAQLGRSRTLFTRVAAIAVATPIPALTPQPFMVGASLVAMGLMSMILNVIMVSLRHRFAPNELLGRVNAGNRHFAWGTMTIGGTARRRLRASAGFRDGVRAGRDRRHQPAGFRQQITDAAITAAERSAERWTRRRSDPPKSRRTSPGFDA
jgi:hypothetical protein